jgi:hypothetical protein
MQVGRHALKGLGLGADVVGMETFEARSQAARAIMGALVAGSAIPLYGALPPECRLALRARNAGRVDTMQSGFTMEQSLRTATGGHGSPSKPHSPHAGPM